MNPQLCYFIHEISSAIAPTSWLSFSIIHTCHEPTSLTSKCAECVHQYLAFPDEDGIVKLCRPVAL